MSKKISDLSDASALDGSEQLEVVQSGSNKKVTVNDLLPVQLQEDKEIELNSHDFEMVDDEDHYWFKVSPGTWYSALEAYKTDDGFANYMSLDASIGQSTLSASQGGTASAYMQVNGSDASNNFFIISATRNGDDAVSISGNGDDLGITYSAATHIFVGINDFANDGAAASGGVPVGGLYHTSGTVKIRLA